MSPPPAAPFSLPAAPVPGRLACRARQRVRERPGGPIPRLPPKCQPQPPRSPAVPAPGQARNPSEGIASASGPRIPRAVLPQPARLPSKAVSPRAVPRLPPPRRPLASSPFRTPAPEQARDPGDGSASASSPAPPPAVPRRLACQARQ